MKKDPICHLARRVGYGPNDTAPLVWETYCGKVWHDYRIHMIYEYNRSNGTKIPPFQRGNHYVIPNTPNKQSPTVNCTACDKAMQLLFLAKTEI